MKKIKVIILVVCILIIMAGFVAYVELSKKAPKVLLSDECKDIEINMANKIAKDIQNVISTSQAGIYEIDNFMYFFDKEERKDESISFRINVTADWIMVRKPIDNPIIIGMYQACNEFDNEKEKNVAQDIIDGFLAEMQPEYKLLETVTYEVVVVLNETSSGHYELYYPIVKEQEETLILLNEYFVVEDRNEKIELGKNTIFEMVKSELNTTD